MTRVCGNCGTEVDDEALFCPTCGQPIEAGVQPELPPAPEWPDTAGGEQATSADAAPAEGASADAGGTDAGGADAGGADDTYVPPWRREPPSQPAAEATPPTGPGQAEVSPPPITPAGAPVSPAPPRPGAARAGAAGNQQVFVMPATLSGWLVGTGAVVGVLAMLLPWLSVVSYTRAWGFASGINVLFAIVLFGVLAAIFTANLLPEIPRRDLTFAGVGLLGVGIGLDRIGLGAAGVGALLFLVGSLAVTAGGFVSLLGIDRTVGEAGP